MKKFRKKKKAWKIKAVIGAILIGVGGIVCCVHPGAGVGIITTGTGLLIDGTAESMDASDRVKAPQRIDRENNKTSYTPLIRKDFYPIAA